MEKRDYITLASESQREVERSGKVIMNTVLSRDQFAMFIDYRKHRDELATVILATWSKHTYR